MATPQGESASDIALGTTSATSESPQPDAPSPPGQQPAGGPTESTQQGAPSQQRQGQVEIPRVRALLHRVAGDLFTPHTVLIGPYHQEVGSYYFPSTGLKNEAVRDMESKHEVHVGHLVLKLYDLVDEVRACYTNLPQNTFLDKDKFCTMLVHDGCYLLSFLMNFNRGTEPSAGGAGSSDGGGDEGRGSGSASDGMISFNDRTLVRDILYLLENQIPLCVLEAILKYLRATTRDGKSTLQLISEEVRHWLHEQRYISDNKEPVQAASTSTPSDLLHVVYSYFRGRHPVGAAAQEEEGSLTGRWRRATDYRKYAGLQFRRQKFKNSQKWSILDMELKGGTLYIPFLRVGADTWTMLRNLMALEEKMAERPVTAFCVFLSQVACTAADVQLLQDAKILEHFMPSNEEAAKAFGYLSNGVALDIDSLDHNYLRHVWHHLDKRCSMRMYNIKGFFCNTHCSNVYYFLVFIIGLLLFLTELGQAVYAGISYHKPKHS